MSDPFNSVTVLRIIQEAETIFDKPGSEEIISQMRENWEVFLMLVFYTGDSGTATEDPTETVLTDSGAAYDADEHNGRSLVIIDGKAAGNIYTIDATAATTLTCTGDTLLADGVKSGDAYKIFYNLKNTVGHTHDAVDSPHVVLADAQVTQAKLKTSFQEQNQSIGDTSFYQFELTGGQFVFLPQVRAATTSVSCQIVLFWHANNNIDDIYEGPAVRIINNDGASQTFYVKQSYVTASGEVNWLFILRDKNTKETIGMSFCPDHPCFGKESPDNVQHPFTNYDDLIHEILVINPDDTMMAEINKLRTIDKPSILEAIANGFDINDKTEPPWPDIPVTVGLPPEWEEKQIGEMIKPIKKVIPKPDYIKTAILKPKIEKKT